MNKEKIDICLFFRTLPPTITLEIKNQNVSTTHSINVLGVIFEATMKWTHQIEATLKKTNSVRFAIQMIAKLFGKKEFVVTVLATLQGNRGLIAAD